MPPLSNFRRGRDASVSGGQPIACRQVQRHEIEPALRLMLADADGLASDEQVLDFLAFTMQRRLDINQLWAALQDDRVLWAMLPVTSPGGTVLFFSPTRLTKKTPLRAIRELTAAVGEEMRSRGIELAQLLLDPRDQPVIHAYTTCGFEQLAELLYLQRTVPPAMKMPEIPARYELRTYSPQTHAQFAETILRSYEQSQDCPALNGRRGIEDIIAGHKATGDFDPKRWMLMYDESGPVAVMLLNRSPHSDGVELVYLGLVPEARGHGVGDLMMRVALASIAKDGRCQVSLAVDARNTPALKLYYRHGLHRVGSRVALLRDLRASHPAPAAEPSIR
jgi:mycothiol synthase